MDFYRYILSIFLLLVSKIVIPCFPLIFIPVLVHNKRSKNSFRGISMKFCIKYSINYPHGREWKFWNAYFSFLRSSNKSFSSFLINPSTRNPRYWSNHLFAACITNPQLLVIVLENRRYREIPDQSVTKPSFWFTGFLPFCPRFFKSLSCLHHIWRIMRVACTRGDGLLAERIAVRSSSCSRSCFSRGIERRRNYRLEKPDRRSFSH